MDEQRALLDMLMGKNRDKLPTDSDRGMHYSDPQVCKHYLVAFCPHDLFRNTKSDLGPCTLIHDDILKSEYVFGWGRVI